MDDLTAMEKLALQLAIERQSRAQQDYAAAVRTVADSVSQRTGIPVESVRIDSSTFKATDARVGVNVGEPAMPEGGIIPPAENVTPIETRQQRRAGARKQAKQATATE